VTDLESGTSAIRFLSGLAESDLPLDELSLSASEPDARGTSGNADAKEAKVVSINNTNIALAGVVEGVSD